MSNTNKNANAKAQNNPQKRKNNSQRFGDNLASQRLQTNQHQMEELDKQIAAVQQSTKTSIRTLSSWHAKLRAESQVYYNWHLNPYSRKTHWAVLFCYQKTPI